MILKLRIASHLRCGSLLQHAFSAREPVQAAARCAFWKARALKADSEVDRAAARALLRAFHTVLARAQCDDDRRIGFNSADPLMHSTFRTARPCDVADYLVAATPWPARKADDTFNATRVIKVPMTFANGA